MKVDFAAKAQPIKGLFYIIFAITFNPSKDVKQFWKLEENERYFSFCDLRTSGDLDSSTCQKIHIGRIQSVLYGAELNSYLLQNLGVKISKKNIQSVLK
jgi:hypothetical protein